MSGFFYSLKRKPKKRFSSSTGGNEEGAQSENMNLFAQPSLSTSSANPKAYPLVGASEQCLSESVNLDDLINEYDGSTKRSLSSSLASLSKVIQISQSYFSATDGVNGTSSSTLWNTANRHHNKNEETTSFYSALQDGFSLNDYDDDFNFEPSSNRFDSTTSPIGVTSISNNNSHILWSENVEQSNEKDILMSPSHFQVYWTDLVYTIKPKISLYHLWNNLEQRFEYGLTNILNFVGRSNRSWSPNSGEPQISAKSEPIKIIQHINGSFKSGELTGVMGPSGAGKTSLLNFLSRRQEEGYNGELEVHTSSNRRIKISAIPQFDHLPEYLTVRENLTFASRLKNAHLESCDHEKNIERVSSLLGLENCLDTTTRKISGGQHKRLAIAQELLSKPDILILDEPTSGLDSLTCYKTVSVLKDLVQASARGIIDPIAIVLTIHQPQQEVFDLFDKIYFLANGGITIYDGPPNNCIEFVEKHTNVCLPDKDYNGASFMVEIASGEYGIEPIKMLEKQVKLEFAQDNIIRRKEAFSKSILNPKSGNKNDKSFLKKSRQPQQQLQQVEQFSIDSAGEETSNIENYDNFRVNNSRASSKPDDSSSSKGSLYIDNRLAKGSSMISGGFFSKLCNLTLRFWLSMLRDPKQMIGRIVYHIILPISMATILGPEPGRANACPNFQAEYDLKELVNGDSMLNKSVQEDMFLSLENIGAIYILIYALTCGNIAITTLSYTLDMQSSLKEYYNGWYHMSSYLLARIISLLPLDLILPVMALGVWYPLSHQATGGLLSISSRVLISCLAVVLCSITGQTLGMIIGSIYIGHVQTALFLSQAITLPMAFLSGFVVRTKNMSKFVQLLSYLSLYKHSIEVSTIARYGYSICPCDPLKVNGQAPRIVGVPEKFNNFVRYWWETLDDSSTNSIATTTASSSLALNNDNETNPLDGGDNKLFNLFAKQVSLYNTYGRQVESCSDVKPLQMLDLSLSEEDIPTRLLSLLILLMTSQILLFVTVKLVIYFKTSL